MEILLIAILVALSMALRAIGKPRKERQMSKIPQQCPECGARLDGWPFNWCPACGEGIYPNVGAIEDELLTEEEEDFDGDYLPF